MNHAVIVYKRVVELVRKDGNHLISTSGLGLGLAFLLWYHFTRTGSMTDLEEAISMRRAPITMSPSHTSRSLQVIQQPWSCFSGSFWKDRLNDWPWRSYFNASWISIPPSYPSLLQIVLRHSTALQKKTNTILVVLLDTYIVCERNIFGTLSRMKPFNFKTWLAITYVVCKSTESPL